MPDLSRQYRLPIKECFSSRTHTNYRCCKIGDRTKMATHTLSENVTILAIFEGALDKKKVLVLNTRNFLRRWSFLSLGG
jgi:hypothetical protein